MTPHDARDVLRAGYEEQFQPLCDAREHVQWIVAGIFVDHNHLDARIRQIAEDVRPIREAIDTTVRPLRTILDEDHVEAAIISQEALIKFSSNLEFLLSGPAPHWDLHRTKIVLEDAIYAADAAIRAMESVTALKRVPRELKA